MMGHLNWGKCGRKESENVNTTNKGEKQRPRHEGEQGDWRYNSTYS
jgi:hypothetical protein